DCGSVLCSGVGQEVAPDAELLSTVDPMASARVFVKDRQLKHQVGVFYEYDRKVNAWGRLDEAAVRAQVWTFLEGARKAGKEKLTAGNYTHKHEPFRPTQRAVSDVLDAVRAVTNLPEAKAAPCWLSDRRDFIALRMTNGVMLGSAKLSTDDKLIAFQNGLLRV